MSLEAERGVLARQGYTTRPRPAIESNATVSPTKSSPAKIPRRRLSKNGHVARAVAESAIGGVGSDSNRHAEGREESLVDELVSRRQRRRTTARPPPPGRDSSTLFSSLSLSSLSLSPAPLKHAPWRAWPSGPRRQPRQRPSWRSWPVKKLGEEWERKDDDGEQNLRKKKNSLTLPSLSLASRALQNKDNQLTGLDFVLRASPAASPAPLSFLAWTCCGKEGRKNEEKKKRGRKT